jgi:hypothetical protein
MKVVNDNFLAQPSRLLKLPQSKVPRDAGSYRRDHDASRAQRMPWLFLPQPPLNLTSGSAEGHQADVERIVLA